MILNVAMEIANTEAEGPGLRYAIWTQGCPFRCVGCCNPGYLPFEGGTQIETGEILERILSTPNLEGISFLGGEPMEQAEALIEIALACRNFGLTVMIFSGYTLNELNQKNDEHVNQLLKLTDLLVDGRYNQNQPDITRRWIGSRNQKLHFLSDKYSPEDPRFYGKETVEIRLSKNGKSVSINGWPTKELLHEHVNRNKSI